MWYFQWGEFRSLGLLSVAMSLLSSGVSPCYQIARAEEEAYVVILIIITRLDDLQAILPSFGKQRISFKKPTPSQHIRRDIPARSLAPPLTCKVKPVSISTLSWKLSSSVSGWSNVRTAFTSSEGRLVSESKYFRDLQGRQSGKRTRGRAAQVAGPVSVESGKR